MTTSGPSLSSQNTHNNSTLPLDAARLRSSRPEASLITASQLIGVTPASGYSWRPPSPPHIHVPPTPDDDDMALPAYEHSTPNGSSREDKEILQAITQGHYTVKAKDWKYESRRTAQPILAFLYLGPSGAIRDINFLRENGITKLLCIRDTTTATSGLLTGQKAAKELGIISEAIDVAGSQQLIAAFPRAIKSINDHLVAAFQSLKHTVVPSSDSEKPTAWGKVLVWCESGNERSATVVAAYLMAMYKLDLIGAIQYVQIQRFCVALDDTLKNLLLSYQQILEAQREVSTPEHDAGQPQNLYKAKRSRGEVEDAEIDMDMETADDLERFGGRSFAPFS